MPCLNASDMAALITDLRVTVREEADDLCRSRD